MGEVPLGPGSFGAGELFSVGAGGGVSRNDSFNPLAPIPQVKEEDMRGPERPRGFPKATQPSQTQDTPFCASHTA